MGLIAFLVVGLLAGWLAGMLLGGRGCGIVGNIVLGIIGVLVGGLLGGMLFAVGVEGFNLQSILVAFLGAVASLLVLRRSRAAGPSSARRSPCTASSSHRRGRRDPAPARPV
jgi:uncharacterized membrane protein YeaQ/YmgE (transglycosylase-associated protein family)